MYRGRDILYSPLSAVVSFCVLYGSMGLRRPLLSGQLNRHIDTRSRATVLSMLSMGSGAYVAVMGPVIGWIADVRVPYALAGMGAIVLAGSALLCARGGATGASRDTSGCTPRPTPGDETLA